jgi:molecular chaperone DnaJ
MASKDFYAVMAVSEKATADEIKKQYRRLAKEHHPDSNKNDPKSAERFKEISEAYQVLGDEKKRAQYDEMRRLGAFDPRGATRARPGGGPRPGAGAPGGGPGGPGSGNFRYEEFNDVGIGGLGDLFSSMFGGGSRGQRPAGPEQGQTIETTLDVPMKVAAVGGKVPIELEVNEECAVCGGSGAAKGARITQCPECSGRGTISFGQGGFAVNRPCPMCLGKGQVPTEKCKECKGAGESRSRRKVIITVPPGVDTGSKIRLKGQGGKGQRGGAPGDIVITFRVTEDPRWQRDGLDLLTHVEINVAQAMLGTKASVETPDERTVAIKIPPGTSSGKRFRVRGQGVAKDGKHGDLIVEVALVVPETLTAEQQKLLEKFADSVGLER